MSERNTVAVKIYGQEYNISGEASREHIMRVADYVDNKMQEIGDAINASNSGVAVLAAVNIADEYFARENDIAELQEKNDQLVSDTQRYSLLWEEAKQSLAQYKEEMAGTRAQQPVGRRVSHSSLFGTHFIAKDSEEEAQTLKVTLGPVMHCTCSPGPPGTHPQAPL